MGLGFYGNSQSMSDELVRLICDGRKRATSSLVWAYESDLEPLPATGDNEIVLDYDGRPAAILSFTKVAVLPFSEVPASFAAAEGEGDLSLEYWRRVHWEFFSSECAQIGRSPANDMPVVCREFELVRVLRGAKLNADLLVRLARSIHSGYTAWTPVTVFRCDGVFSAVNK